MKIKIQKLHEAARLPTYATDGSAAFDLHALTVDGMFTIGKHVWNGQPVTCRTGIAFEIPPGWVMLVFSRSGHGFKHATRLANCVGVIDSDYRGEVHVKLTSDLSLDDENRAPLFVAPGDRIAQAMLVQVPAVEFDVVEQLSATARGTGGLGSTGA